MVKRNVPVLLAVMSIVQIVLGIITLLMGLFGFLTGGALIGLGDVTGSGVITVIGIAVIVLSCIAGVLQLLMGIFGLRAQHLTFCCVMGVITVALAVSQLFMGGSMIVPVASFVSIGVAVLYLLGIIVAIQQRSIRR